ncbi:hydrogenobyrinic acid a,c-diamide synthase (glutamine-hydrolysing) /cobyrinate a,c-diamide synthase [Rhodobacter viridis]|uniref:Hydrogenobyrinate a,c-diamide synthase n=1 Tax=Rhodobacter viridis TaxID=1054202 RepID=A0A318TT81_9RHOB|nr:cobyrinate a,c-diamide synthase [Rhodobacter viridis]PYF07137.1 hydrogenobyrinic acid a,c-diamide synthase (glutamine-hydrolysing) /cobyrinate a,c-diamide synthase [Rhodobacter viridis]
MSDWPKGLAIAAPASGSGKTTLTLGLLRALTRRGLKVQPFKNGPDYIDPAFHAAAAGRPSFNLDGWAMGAGLLDALAGQAAGADLVIFEGAMGLYDGPSDPGRSGRGASSEIARMFGWPVVLVLDVKGQGQSAAATALGFARHPEAPPMAGVILNNVASPRHESMIRAEMDRLGLPVLGALPRRADLSLPERHLGLVQAEEQAGLDATLEALAEFVAAHVDLEALLAASGSGLAPGPGVWPVPPAGRIALARDAAFSFVYPHMLETWRRAGVTVLPFSPLADEAPDPSADLCWLPGGYPELHAGRIAAASRFKDGLRAFAETRPVHGECGGYMVLGAALVDAEGVSHAMTGLLGLVTSYEKRRLHLGYRSAELLAPLPGYAFGARLYGHEFHYSTILAQPDAALAKVCDAAGNPVPETGSVRGNVTGSFFHLIAG